MMVQWKPLIKQLEKSCFTVIKLISSFPNVANLLFTMQYYMLCRNNTWRRKQLEKSCFQTRKKVPFYLLFIFISVSVIRLNSRANKIKRILYSEWAHSWFLAVIPLEKNSLLTMKYILPLSSGSTKTQKFGSKKTWKAKNGNWDLPILGEGK